MTAPEPILSLSNFPDVVRQHATPKCTPTPITTATIPVRRYKAGLYFPWNWSPRSSNRRSPTLQHPTAHLPSIEIP